MPHHAGLAFVVTEAGAEGGGRGVGDGECGLTQPYLLPPFLMAAAAAALLSLSQPSLFVQHKVSFFSFRFLSFQGPLLHAALKHELDHLRSPPLPPPRHGRPHACGVPDGTCNIPFPIADQKRPEIHRPLGSVPCVYICIRTRAPPCSRRCDKELLLYDYGASPIESR